MLRRRCRLVTILGGPRENFRDASQSIAGVASKSFERAFFFLLDLVFQELVQVREVLPLARVDAVVARALFLCLRRVISSRAIVIRSAARAILLIG